MHNPLLTAFLLITTIASACTNTGATSVNKVDVDTDSVALPHDVTLTFTGDVMMGTNFPSDYITPDRGKTLFQDCDSIMRAADISIVNLEGTCYDGTDGELRKMTNPNTYYIFRMPGDHAQRLKDAGVDAVNMANNHSFDFGMTGRRKTIANMHKHGIEVAGVREATLPNGEGQGERSEAAIMERRGVKYAYISFAASCTKVLDMLNRNEVDSMINKYRKLGDVLIVSFHGGAEGTSYRHVPFKEEYYVGEDRGNVHDFAHHCIDMGADMVIGHGPHVPRAMELYKGHIIAYSLGNFCAPYRMGMAAQVGLAPLLEVHIDPSTGKFLSGHIHSYRQVHGKGPRRDLTNAAAQDIRQLSLTDFPSSPLVITQQGQLSCK